MSENIQVQARSTDPLTSHLSAQRATLKADDFCLKVLKLLVDNGSLDVQQIASGLEMKETIVSPVMRPMARKGLIHEEGWHRSRETGHQRILWAAGPDLHGSTNSMPLRRTGPHKNKIHFQSFTWTEIEHLIEKVASDPQQFTGLLNAAVLERVVLQY